jgi:hypothetical protein
MAISHVADHLVVPRKRTLKKGAGWATLPPHKFGLIPWEGRTYFIAPDPTCGAKNSAEYETAPTTRACYRRLKLSRTIVNYRFALIPVIPRRRPSTQKLPFPGVNFWKSRFFVCRRYVWGATAILGPAEFRELRTVVESLAA